MPRCTTLLLVLGLALRPGPAAAQQDSVPAPEPRSEVVATALAVIFPGAGHVYAGETGRGLLLGGAATLALMYGLGDAPCLRFYDDARTCEREDQSETLATASLVLGVGLYWYSLWDAHRAVRRTNRRRGLALGPLRLAPLLSTGPGRAGAVRVGARLTLARRAR